MALTKKHILEVDSIQYEINGRNLLLDVYLKCETGIVTVIKGRNGVGKSTLFKIIYGVLNSESSVRFNGISVKQSFKIPKMITYLPQHNFLPSSATIKKIISNFKLNLSDFLLFLPEFKLRLDEKIIRLSGGEKRIIEVYTIIKSNSEFSILDEPFTNLSPIQIESIKELIVKEKLQKGFIITDHLQHHIQEIQDWVYELHDGKLKFVK